jgi:hypothetical protein
MQDTLLVMAVTAAPTLTCQLCPTFDCKERQMRIELIGGSVAIALVALLSSAAPSQAYIPQPWCSDSIETAAGAPVCMYSSYHQCVENTLSRGGCVANPAIEPLPTVPGSTTFMLSQPVHHTHY